MGKALRFKLLYTFVLFLALILADSLKSYAQVPVVDLQSFEISFTDEESNREKRGVLLSMQEAKRMSGLEIDAGQPFRFTTEQANQKGFYYVDNPGGAALGRYYHTSDSGVLSQIPVRNGTPYNISGVSIAFDFIYLAPVPDSDADFQLSYRVNNGQWIAPSGGHFNSDVLQASDDGWNSFSMQIRLDQLFLLPNDQLTIRWTASGADDITDFIPIALQKIELFSTKAAPVEIDAGSLIISEILPGYRTERGFFEFVEIYNSTENPINLKGLILRSGDQQVVVQKDVVAKPFSAVLLAARAGGNAPLADRADYLYDGSLLRSISGRLALRFNDALIARALFESPRQGISVEMERLEQAFDGYSGLSHFMPSDSEFESLFSGTPGYIDPENRFYSRSIQTSGWYLLQPPGELSGDLNREIESRLVSLIKTDEGGEQQKPPYSYYHDEGHGPIKMYASGQGTETTAAESSETVVASRVEPRGIFPDMFTPSQQVAMPELRNSEGVQAIPALLTWNDKRQTFELLSSETDTLLPWNTYVAPAGMPDTEVLKRGGADDQTAYTGLSRLIDFELKSDTDNISYDRAIIGFWGREDASNKDLSLPKLWTPIQHDSRQIRHPLIYLRHPDDAAKASSYLNFAYSPESLVQISLGVKMPSTISQARLDWSRLETLPERWKVELVDAKTGISIDMREESSYTFSENEERVGKGMNDADLNFNLMETDDYNRFFIRISPTGVLGEFEAETEAPESIELRQNYPNPFNPTTTIEFFLPAAADVRVGVFNVVGQQVGRLIDERLGAGDHRVIWNAQDMPSGVYIVQLEAMNTVQTRKITLIK